MSFVKSKTKLVGQQSGAAITGLDGNHQALLDKLTRYGYSKRGRLVGRSVPCSKYIYHLEVEMIELYILCTIFKQTQPRNSSAFFFYPHKRLGSKTPDEISKI